MDIIGFIKEGKKEMEEKKKKAPKKIAKKPSKKSASGNAAKKLVKKEPEPQTNIPPKREDIKITERESVQVSNDFPKTESHTFIDGVHVGIKANSPKPQPTVNKSIEQMLSGLSLSKDIPNMMDYGVPSESQTLLEKQDKEQPKDSKLENKAAEVSRENSKPEKHVHFAESAKQEVKVENAVAEEKKTKQFDDDDIFQPKFTPFKYEFSNFGTLFTTLESWCTQYSKLYLQGKEDVLYTAPKEEALTTISAPSPVELRRQAMASMLTQQYLFIFHFVTQSLPSVCSRLSLVLSVAEKEILQFSRTFSFTKAIDSLSQLQWITIILVLLEV